MNINEIQCKYKEHKWKKNAFRKNKKIIEIKKLKML